MKPAALATLGAGAALLVAAVLAAQLPTPSLARPAAGAPHDGARLAQWALLAGPARDDAALARLRTEAASGVPAAQRLLGQALLARGQADGTAEARHALRQAADRGDAEAQLALGRLLYKGAPGLAPAPAEAVPPLAAAVAAGQPAAAYYLGLIHKNGAPGVARDPAAAVHWLGIAAQGEVPDAQFLLGQMLLVGDGAPADPARARTLFEAAAEREHPEAALQLAMASARGEMGFARDGRVEAAQLREAQHALRHRPPAP